MLTQIPFRQQVMHKLDLVHKDLNALQDLSKNKELKKVFGEVDKQQIEKLRDRLFTLSGLLQLENRLN